MVKELKFSPKSLVEGPAASFADRYVKAFGATKIVNEACKAVSICDFDWAREMVVIVLSADAALVSEVDLQKATKLYDLLSTTIKE